MQQGCVNGDVDVVPSIRAVPTKFSWGGVKLACADKNGSGRWQMGVVNKIWRALYNQTLEI